MHQSKELLVAAVAVMTALAALPAGAVDENAAGGEATYAITITNLTGGQPFTPALVATHRSAEDLFEVGEPASASIQQIAENGNLAPAMELLAASIHVSDWGVFAGETGVPPIVPGETVDFTLTSDPGARFLTWVSMLICTNDGFTGLDSVKLPKKVGDSLVLHTNGYDAGTEVNTEDYADIVPPCQGLVENPANDGADDGTGMTDPSLAENGVVHHHAGIIGGMDLVPAIHGWNDPVATVTIERTG